MQIKLDGELGILRLIQHTIKITTNKKAHSRKMLQAHTKTNQLLKYLKEWIE